MRRKLLALFPVLVACAVGLTACGGGNPAAPSATAQGVVLNGTVLGSVGAASVAAHSGSSSAAGLTVTVVEEPAITTTVSAEGTFTLRGLPQGSFTLAFSLGSTSFGTLSFDSVSANQQITITVSISGTAVVLLDEQRNGIGHGDVEVEGPVSAVLVVDPTGESRFVVNGRTIVARPGETAIRSGNAPRSIEDVTVGTQVHVKGSYLPPEGATQPILASEIKIQGSTNDGPGTPQSFCPTSGGRVEAEGKIVAKGASDITVAQQGKGLYDAQTDDLTTIRKGNKTFLFSDLQIGWRVHVKGSSLGLTADTCGVQASEIKVQ